MADYEEGVKSRSLELEAVAMVAIGPHSALAVLALINVRQRRKTETASNH